MYNINILTECNDENVRVAIIVAVSELMNSGDSNFIVNRVRRSKVEVPVWNSISRQENLRNKF